MGTPPSMVSIRTRLTGRVMRSMLNFQHGFSNVSIRTRLTGRVMHGRFGGLLMGVIVSIRTRLTGRVMLFFSTMREYASMFQSAPG